MTYGAFDICLRQDVPGEEGIIVLCLSASLSANVQILPDRATRPQTLEPLPPAVTGPSVTQTDQTRLHGMHTKPTVLQTAGKATLICGNVSSCGSFTSYSPGTASCGRLLRRRAQRS
jgi:hypothetical protein